MINFFWILGTLSALQPNEENWNWVDSIVHEALKEFDVPGASIGLVVDGKPVLVRGYGLRDMEQNLPVTADTVFSLASGTKGFTCHLLDRLVEEGKLAWDDPVFKHIPEFRVADPLLTSQVTVRDLAAHRTGLPRHDVLWYCILDLPRSEVIKLMSHFEPVHGLREKFLYTNFTYAIAGAVIERVTGKTWEEELFSRIFQPLGMKNSSTSVANESDRAIPYAKLEGKIQEVPLTNLAIIAPAGAIRSTASDMVKWVQLQLKEGPKETHALQIAFPSPMEENIGYGLGWFVGKYRDRPWINHGGTIDGFRSEVSFFPEEKIGLVIFTNSSTEGDYAITAIRNRIFDRLLNQPEIDWIQKIKEKPTLTPSAPTFREVSPSVLKTYEGHYHDPLFGTMEVSLKKDQLIATLGRMKVRLHFKEKDHFEAEFPELLRHRLSPFVEFNFVSPDELQVPFEHFRMGKPIVFHKIDNR